MKPALPNILEQSNSFISNFFFLVILLSMILQTLNTAINYMKSTKRFDQLMKK